MMLLIALFLAFSSFSAQADMFTDVGSSWTKVSRPDDVVQWAVNPPHMVQPTRIDFVSFEEDGAQKTFYLIQMKCLNGVVEIYTGRPNAALAIGENCSGEMDTTRMIGIALSHVPNTPQEMLTP